MRRSQMEAFKIEGKTSWIYKPFDEERTSWNYSQELCQ